jgi:phosphoenolpyruvate carboxykinase (GTP)
MTALDVRPHADLGGDDFQSHDVHRWVRAVAELAQPDEVVWCDGSEEENARLTSQLVAAGTFIPLDGEKHYHSFLARSAPDDVARVEDRTYICSALEDDAGPTNNWREPGAMREELSRVFTDSMRGRTMYVVPFSMGPVGGPLSRLGVEITDSPYVVVSMRVMTRIGAGPRALVEGGQPWVKAVHSVGAPLVDEDGRAVPDVPWPSSPTKHIAHFPESREIWSFGSGYGGNALLGKKCFALRIASVIARDEGWLAEHMLIIKVVSPAGRAYHIAAAFPSACGKTNLAMLRTTLPGWHVETIGDDIAWMRRDDQGRLRAINPEAGLFGVAPGTSAKTNPTAIESLWGNTVFTNVALTDDGDVWWEGLDDHPPAHLVDWTGKDWTPASGTPAAHPNSRFTVPAAQVPSIASDWDDPEGVVIDAFLFGGRRATNVPLVAEARDWDHGVFMGATVSSEQTAAAAESRVGELRRDPFAMLPFCGYNMADHWAHWVRMGEELGERGRPRIYSVNWFRKGSDGSYLWPGFGDNSRVLAWIIRRLEGEAEALDTPAGLIPKPGDLDVSGLDVSEREMAELFAIDPAAWAEEADLTEEFFARFGDRVPPQLREQLAELRARLQEGSGDAAKVA